MIRRGTGQLLIVIGAVVVLATVGLFAVSCAADEAVEDEVVGVWDCIYKGRSVRATVDPGMYHLEHESGIEQSGTWRRQGGSVVVQRGDDDDDSHTVLGLPADVDDEIRFKISSHGNDPKDIVATYSDKTVRFTNNKGETLLQCVKR